ncbi:MAG: hypothetical protein LBD53_06210 [Tannerella sp.]|nr:hypothetical protein [Tannerella sp.]
MQLNKNINCRPLFVTAGIVFSGGNVSYSESYSYYYRDALFRDYYTKWQQETMLSSSVKAIIGNKNFKSIVEMKYGAVPFIIEKKRVNYG